MTLAPQLWSAVLKAPESAPTARVSNIGTEFRPLHEL